MSSSEWRILLFVVVATHGLLALDIVPQEVLVTLKPGHITLKPSSTNKNLKLDEAKDETPPTHDGPASKEFPQTQMIERRVDHHEVTHGVGYSTHLDPQYYQGNHMGKYYDCALQGPWKPIQGHYEHRAPAATGDSPQIINQHHHHMHHQPEANHHHHEHSGPNNHGGNAFGTNYVEEWDQRLKEVLQGHPQRNPGNGGHRNVAPDGGHHHSGGQEVGQNSGGYMVTSTGYDGSGGAGSPYNGWEDHPEGHHSADLAQGHPKGVKGGKGSASFQSDFPYQFDNKWHDWIHEPYDGSATNDEGHEGFLQDSGQEEDHPELNAFHEAVKNIGDLRYTHAIFGLVGDPEEHEGEGQREGAASQGHQGAAVEGDEEGGFHHHAGPGVGSAGAEEPSGGGGHHQGHATPSGGEGAYGAGDGYAVGGGQSEEGGEQSNPSGDYTSGGTGKGVETGGDFNGKMVVHGDFNGGMVLHGDFNAPHSEAPHQPQPSHQSSPSGGTGYGGGQGQVVSHPYSESTEGAQSGGGGGNQNFQGHYPQGGVQQYESPPPRCPYAHDHMHHAAPMGNAIHSLPYDEGVHASHLQIMMPPKLQSHVNLISVLPLKQYEVYEKQEESENKETIMDGMDRPNYIPSGQHAYHGGERPLSDDASIQQQGHGEETFAEPNKVVDGSSLPAEQEDGDDFLQPPPLMVTDHYIKGNGNFKGFSDGRRKRRPFGRPGSHSGVPHAALYKRPPPFMMRARPVIRRPVKRLSFV